MYFKYVKWVWGDNGFVWARVHACMHACIYVWTPVHVSIPIMFPDDVVMPNEHISLVTWSIITLILILHTFMSKDIPTVHWISHTHGCSRRHHVILSVLVTWLADYGCLADNMPSQSQLLPGDIQTAQTTSHITKDQTKSQKPFSNLNSKVTEVTIFNSIKHLQISRLKGNRSHYLGSIKHLSAISTQRWQKSLSWAV